MRWNNLDTLVKGLLLKEQKPLHFYLQFLTYACSGLSKLNVHTLKHVNTKMLPVTAYKAVQIPVDYVDWVQVGFKVGERVRPLIYDDSLNSLNNYGADGRKAVHDNTLPDGTTVDMYKDDSWYVDNVLDTPYFGRRTDRDDWKFKVLPHRGEHGEIQLSADFPYNFVILDYITDGLEADAATKIDPLAVPALEKFIMWQIKLHSRTANEGEKREAERRFNDEHRLLRAAKNNLTRDEILHAVRSGYNALYRN
jgi:hypothetical protein